MEIRLQLRTYTSFKKYSFQRMLTKFLKINCKRKRLGMLITRICTIGSTTKNMRPAD